MPIYEYQCEACGERTETIQPRSARPLKKCPKCGGKLRKLLSAPSFQFKGSGWYATDYGGKTEARNSDSSRSSDADDSSSATKVASSEAGTASKESKGETKASPKVEKEKGKPSKPSKPASSSS